MKRKIAALLSVLMVMSCSVGPASAAGTGLDEATKQEYYNEYVEIAKEISEKTGIRISVHPISEFTEEDWLPTEEYRQLITELATCEPVVDDTIVIRDTVPMASDSIGGRVSATKNVKFSFGGKEHTIAVTGVFTTYYEEFHDRQIFEGYESISTKLISGSGSWRQHSNYEVNLADGRRTYTFTLSGTFTLAGTSVDKVFTVSFYCGANGSVS